MNIVVVLLILLVSLPAFAQKLTHEDFEDKGLYKLRIYHYDNLPKVLQDVDDFLKQQKEIRIEDMRVILAEQGESDSHLNFTGSSVSDSVFCDCLPSTKFGMRPKDHQWIPNVVVKNDGGENYIGGGISFYDNGDFVEVKCTFTIYTNAIISFDTKGKEEQTRCYMINIKNQLFDYLLKRYPDKPKEKKKK